MFAQPSFWEHPPEWVTWASPVVGVLVAALLLWLGRSLLAWFRPQQSETRLQPPRWTAPSAGVPAPGAPVDPFVAGPSGNRRTWLRRKGRSIEVFFYDPSTHTEAQA